MLLKDLGEKSLVEIEPDNQTILADATQSLPGVLCSGVPGAGGVDAVYAICLTGARKSVELLWSEWYDQRRVCPLLLTADNCDSRVGIYLEKIN